ncbi:MAG: hypothetical protein AAF202_05000, partial [Pseudomonadota bacterium]
LSVPYLSLLLEKVYQWTQVKPIEWSLETCVNPPHFNPAILPKEALNESASEFLKEYKELYHGNRNAHKVENMFADFLEEPPNARLVWQLIAALDTLDRRRGTSWRQTFPWLEKLSSKIG